VWATLIGLLAAGLLGWLRPTKKLKTAIISFVVVSLLSGGLGGLIVHHGWNAGIDNLVLRHENWNGWEAKPVAEPRDCRLNGGCVNHYDCNAHKVVDSAAYTDKNGYHSETSHTEWDSCPKYEREVDYTLPTTLYVPVSVAKIGEKAPDTKNVVYNMGEGWVPNGTREWHGWEAEGHSNAGVHYGVPPAWAAAEARYEAHRPGPVTVRVDYENAILASEYTIFQNYSDAVPGYIAAGVLPKVQGAVHDQFLADRAYMQACPFADAAKFQQGVGYLNGDVGQDLQGDLHFVCVDITKVPAARAENYFGALMAHWKSPAMGLDPLSKNGIVVAVGVDPATQKVAWVRADTGMPVGNVDMKSDFAKNVEDGGLVGANLDAQTLFGSPTATVQWNATKKKFKATTITPGDGLIAKILWGQHKFVRVQMKDFKYLKDEIVPSPSQQHWTIFWAVFWTVILWIVAFLLSIFVFTDGFDEVGRSGRYNSRATRRF
jgi:hypothetical protein